MFNISVSTTNMLANNVDCYAYIVEKNFETTVIAEEIKKACPELLSVIKQKKFVGAALESIIVPFVNNNKLVYCCLIGLGEAESKSGIRVIERYRRAVGQLVKVVSGAGCTSVALELISPSKDISLEYLAEQVAIICNVAQYHFNDFITEKSRKTENIDVTLVVDEKNKKLQPSI